MSNPLSSSNPLPSQPQVSESGPSSGNQPGPIPHPDISPDAPKVTFDAMHELFIKLFGKEVGDRIYNEIVATMTKDSLMQTQQAAKRALDAKKKAEQG